MANKDWPIRPPYSDRSPVRYDSLSTNKTDDFRVAATEGAGVQHGEHSSNNPPHEKHEKHAILSNSIQKADALPRHPPQNENFEFWRQGNKQENKNRTETGTAEPKTDNASAESNKNKTTQTTTSTKHQKKTFANKKEDPWENNQRGHDEHQEHEWDRQA